MTRLGIRVALVMGVTTLLISCRTGSTPEPPVNTSAATAAASAPSPCTLALAPDTGTAKTDAAIARLQLAAADLSHGMPQRVAAVNDLGQYFISKARVTRDASYYRRAEASAQCAAAWEPGNAQSLLLRGHVLHQEHRFKEAEQLARQLVAKRGLFLDYGLLGDALMEQGKIDEAGEAYQKMMDLKPFYQSYTRAAHLRWLKGDLPGAIALMRLAVKAASPRDPESVAWASSRLAVYELQAGHIKAALDLCQSALGYQPAYPPALLARARALLADKRPAEAVAALQDIVKADPAATPEYQWTLAEALSAAGHADDARAIDASIRRTGSEIDPRTFALYLATRGEQPNLAVTLARRELDTRADAFTLDALAWALAAAGQPAEADAVMQRALAAGTRDARLFYHAGVIAAALHDQARATRCLRKALAEQQMLLPSEQAQAARVLRAFTRSNPSQEKTLS